MTVYFTINVNHKNSKTRHIIDKKRVSTKERALDIVYKLVDYAASYALRATKGTKVLPFIELYDARWNLIVSAVPSVNEDGSKTYEFKRGENFYGMELFEDVSKILAERQGG